MLVPGSIPRISSPESMIKCSIKFETRLLFRIIRDSLLLCCLALRVKKRTLNILISVFATTAILLFLFYKVRIKLSVLDLQYASSLIFDSWETIILLCTVFLLMPLNLLTEALKWKKVANSLYPVSIRNAYSGILAGITAGLLLPNRVGEFAGKALVLPLNQFWKGSVLAVFTSIAQLAVTIVAGLCAVAWFGPSFFSFAGLPGGFLTTIVAICGIVSILLLYFSIHLVAFLFRKWKKLHKTISVIESVKTSLKFRIFLLSVLRYFVFAGQNLLLLTLFEVKIPLPDSFFLIALMYLFLTAIPTFVITDFPARSSVMLLIFLAWYEMNGMEIPYALEAKIIYTSFSIWVINLIIPAVPGLYYLNKFSLLRKEKS